MPKCNEKREWAIEITVKCGKFREGDSEKVMDGSNGDELLAGVDPTKVVCCCRDCEKRRKREDKKILSVKDDLNVVAHDFKKLKIKNFRERSFLARVL